MGLVAVDSRQQQQLGGDIGRVEDISREKDRKKKQQRPSRRTKHGSPTHGSAYGFPPENYLEATTACVRNGTMASTPCSSKHRGPCKQSNVASNLLPAMQIGDRLVSSVPRVRILTRSCREPIRYDQPMSLSENMDFVGRQKRFDPHWHLEAVNQGLQKGEVFQATFRINAHNTLEAYCTIDGVPLDIFISGMPMQNRAVDGDVVAVKVDPPHLWTRLKSSAGFSNSSATAENIDPLTEVSETISGKLKLKENDVANLANDHSHGRSASPFPGQELRKGTASPSGILHQEATVLINGNQKNGHHSVQGPSKEDRLSESSSVGKLCKNIADFLLKRPTGKVVAVLEPSARRDAVVGFLNLNLNLCLMGSHQKDICCGKSLVPFAYNDYIWLLPTDPKFQKMMVRVEGLPDAIRKRLDENDPTIEKELVAARIVGWDVECPAPEAQLLQSFGHGGEVEPHIAAILFENSVCLTEFSADSLSCLPEEKWEVPVEELECRKDIRNLCVFTIDPSTATDLDDALSIEKISKDIYRVGVHIADVSYFVQPDTALDTEAQVRSTSVYLLNRKLSMLPPLLSEDLGSLVPGADRLAFSIFWDMNLSGTCVDRWICRTVMRSCCKLSYEHAQDIIDRGIDVEGHADAGFELPPIYGPFEKRDIIESVTLLHEVSKTLKEKRFSDGALRLESSKISFLLDDCGIPYDSVLCERKDSNFLVEGFMLLANRTAAEIISRTYPDSALLRRHPEPNMRKLKEFEAFCGKHGLELNTSSSGSFHHSLEKIKDKLKDDSVLYELLLSYATRPMQLAKYFCTGDANVDEDDWGHYALAVPLYTHFTSPLRRYPDIVVHRTLAAAMEAEEMYLKAQSSTGEASQVQRDRCFTGIHFDKAVAESVLGQQVLSAAASKHRVPGAGSLCDVAAYCNKRKLASRHVKDAVDRLYMWILLKNKEVMISEARVVGLGPRFMSIYIHRLAIERRIYYDEVEGLMVEWLETTSTLVLYFFPNRHAQRRGSPSKFRPLEDVALLVSPCDLMSETMEASSSTGDPDPAVFPMTVHLLSTIPVALHAVGGDYGPLDIGARLYVSSYLK
ncbi:hypothetical protein Droror1_Dr00027694 [Drosera rotundifolia]